MVPDGVNQSAVRKSGGFTIVELMLATSVFSLVLLAALASFLQVGHLFYKGVTLTNTQNIATGILNDISNSMQTASSISAPANSGGYTYMCIGNTRYTYTSHSYSYNGTGYQVSNTANLSASSPNYSSGSSGTFGLLKDTLAGNSACAPPCVSSCGTPFNKPVEMLGDQTRVTDLEIVQPNSTFKLYNIKLVVTYGGDSVLDFSGSTTQPSCAGDSANQAFCSVVNLSTSVLVGSRT